MKVSLCPKCRVTPNISITELKCPKCGRTVTGKDLTDTVTKWNDGKAKEEPKTEVEEVKEESKEEVKKNNPVRRRSRRNNG